MKNPSLEIINSSVNKIQGAFLSRSELGLYSLVINLESKYLDYRIQSGFKFDENNKIDKHTIEFHFEGADDEGESRVILSTDDMPMKNLHRLEESDGDQLLIHFIPNEMLLKQEVIASVKID